MMAGGFCEAIDKACKTPAREHLAMNRSNAHASPRHAASSIKGARRHFPHPPRPPALRLFGYDAGRLSDDESCRLNCDTGGRRYFTCDQADQHPHRVIAKLIEGIGD